MSTSPKAILLLRFTETWDVTGLLAHASAVVDRHGLTGLVLDMVIPRVGSESSAPDYEVIVEAWGPESALALLRRSPWPNSAVQHSYAVDEMVEKGSALPGCHGGIKVVAPLVSLPTAHEKVTRHHWDSHVPLALETHVGMCDYVRNWVTSTENDSPPFFGFAMLRFPTEDDILHRYLAEPKDEYSRRLADDVARFVSRAVKLFATERVFPGNPQIPVGQTT